MPAPLPKSGAQFGELDSHFFFTVARENCSRRAQLERPPLGKACPSTAAGRFGVRNRQAALPQHLHWNKTSLSHKNYLPTFACSRLLIQFLGWSL